LGTKPVVTRSGSAVGRVLGRRKLLRSAAWAALGGGVAGGSLLGSAGPAFAASRGVAARQARGLVGQSAAPAGTTVEPGAVAPAVVALADAATITVDASQGNDFRVTLGANRTMGTPANPANGQQIIFQITQGSAGSSAITWDTGYEFSTGLPQPTLSSTAGQTDLLGFIYNAAKGKWLLAAFVNGFS
jgi:hypothetical protein